MSTCFPRLYAAASLKPAIEAKVSDLSIGFPRLYAAASLKPPRTPAPASGQIAFSAALCRGLIEAAGLKVRIVWRDLGFPRLYAAASLKLLRVAHHALGALCFPRLYAAASLKRYPPTR